MTTHTTVPKLVCVGVVLAALFVGQARAQRIVHQNAAPQSVARAIFTPAHPGTSVEAVVEGALAPPGRAWLADLHLEFADVPISVGLRGAFFRCAGCQDLDGDPDDDRTATATAHVAYSRSNYAIGGTLNFALGYELDTRNEVAAVGGGLWLRLGRVDGIRADIGVAGFGGGHQFASFGPSLSLRIPVFANATLRVWLEGRAEVVLPAPVVILLSGAVRARIGPIIVGLRAFNTRKQTSLLLALGFRLDAEEH